MRKNLIIFWTTFLLSAFLFFVLAIEVKALELDEATSSTEKIEEKATASAILEKEKITEPTSQVKGKLEAYLMEHPSKPLAATNFLQHLIRQVVQKGVAANTIVLILLFPLVAAIIAASRHIVGIRGFGIFLPAVLSVVFVSTGIIEGLLLFLTIIGVATIARMFLQKMKIQYLPRMALLLWFVCLGVLGFLFLSPSLKLNAFSNLSIFPILILILLTENFISIQIGMSMREAMSLTFETLIIALICSLVLQLEFLQLFVLVNPEIAILTIAILDIFMGKYVGLRLLEYKKFKQILK